MYPEVVMIYANQTHRNPTFENIIKCAVVADLEIMFRSYVPAVME